MTKRLRRTIFAERKGRFIVQKTVLLGMSGGVDSSVAVHLLQKQGYKVIGCHLLFTEDSSKDSASALRALHTADRFGIPLIFSDRRELFRERVTDAFCRMYAEGLTPNPCIMCNTHAKFVSLAEEADKAGAELIATGHYARTENTPGCVKLMRAPTRKDQTYFLYRVPSEILARTVFPLGDFTSKDEIRAIGRTLGLEAAASPDSQDICFIPDGDTGAFLSSRLPKIKNTGDILDIGGNKIGTHNGIFNYTVGQRKGLGAFGKPMYVSRINAADNTVTVCTSGERFTDTVRAHLLKCINGDFPSEAFSAEIMIRSTAFPVKAAVTVCGDVMTARLEKPVFSPCPGQSAVLYNGDTVIGGGIIF